MVWALGGRGKRGRSAGGFSGSLGLEDRWARRYQGGTEMILRADFPFSECGLAGMGPCPKYTPVQPTKPVEDGQPFLSALGSRGSPFLPKPAGSVPSIPSSPRTRPALCSQPHAQCPSYFPPHHADPSSPPLSSPSALWGLVPTFCSPLLPATGSPCGFSSLEILPFSGLRALSGQGPRAGLCPGHWKMWATVQTQVGWWLHGLVCSSIYGLRPLALVFWGVTWEKIWAGC